MVAIPAIRDIGRWSGLSGYGGRMARHAGAAALTALALAAAGCSSSAAPNSGGTSPASGRAGGTYTILANAAPPGALDPAQNYTLQEWQLLIDTHDGLVQFQRVGGVAGTKIASALANPSPPPAARGETDPFPHPQGRHLSHRPVPTPRAILTTFPRHVTVPHPVPP